VNFLNNLFDSVNGDERDNNNELRCPITKNSEHHVFWVSAKETLRKMKFIDKISHKTKSVPSIVNWIFTIDGFQKLWKIVNETYDFFKLNAKYCNQDPLENFFGQIRSHARRNINPTPRQFQESFFTLLVNNIQCISIRHGNCEVTKDNFNILFTLEEYLQNRDVHSNNLNNFNEEASEIITEQNVAEEFIIASSLDNTDKIIQLILKEVQFCTDCESSLTNSDFLNCMKQIICFINKLLKTRAHRRNICKLLLTFLDNWNVNMDWHECIEHHANMYKILIRVIAGKTIACWCDKKNKLLYNNNDDISMLHCNIINHVSEIKKMNESYKTEKRKRKKIVNEYKDCLRKKRK